MTREPIPVRSETAVECRNCGAGAPVDEHFCPNCSRILALGRHGDYFAFFGLPRALVLDQADLERRFRDMSRKFHPDYYYNAPAAERLASLERSSYLNDAFRTLRSLPARIEYLLAIEGLPPARSEEGTVKAPASLLEDVFELNEQLDGVREMRQSGAPPDEVRRRLEAARAPIDRRRDEHEARLRDLSARWDAERDQATPPARRAILELLREQLLERNYITNLLSGIERESAG
jgi:molecular chaperone HscB